MGKPTTLRLSKSTEASIKQLLQGSSLSVSDFVRAAVEEKVNSAGMYQRELLSSTSDVEGTVSKLVERFAPGSASVTTPATLNEMGSMLNFIHRAYLRGGRWHSGRANPCYVTAALSLVEQLLQVGVAQKIHLDYLRHFPDMGGPQDPVTIRDKFGWLKDQFIEKSSISLAEVLLRPCSSLAEELDKFPVEDLQSIFASGVIRSLLPVLTSLSGGLGALKGCRYNPHSDRDGASSAVLPLGGIRLSLHRNPLLSLSIDSENHRYTFQPEMAMPLFLVAQYGWDAMSEDDDIYIAGLNMRNEDGQVSISDCVGYKVRMSGSDFGSTMEWLRSLLADGAWYRAIEETRLTFGDL